jgi:hypothetical protein
MLAQNFLPHADLGITEIERDALATVLGMLERGEIDTDHFAMDSVLFEGACGTVGCICGWAHIVSDRAAFPEVQRLLFGSLLQARVPLATIRLFAITGDVDQKDIYQSRLIDRVRRQASPEEAATALRSYLTTGEANWAEALAAQPSPSLCGND